MYSKNNKYMQEQKSANRAQRFSLRKLSSERYPCFWGH